MYGTKDEKREQLEAFLYYWGVLNEKTLADQLLKNYNMEQWVTDREPTSYECDSAGDTGFILCISGQYENMGYDHAIVMSECFYEEDQWFISGVGADGLTIHGWMLPPEWEGKNERITRTDTSIRERGAGKALAILRCSLDKRTRRCDSGTIQKNLSSNLEGRTSAEISAERRLFR